MAVRQDDASVAAFLQCFKLESGETGRFFQTGERHFQVWVSEGVAAP